IPISTPGYAGTNDMSKSIICEYVGDMKIYADIFDDLDPKSIPKVCDFVEFYSFSVNQSSGVWVKQELLDKVKALRKQIIMNFNRYEGYMGWTLILGPNGNENETKLLCDFAKNNSIKGFTIYNFIPSERLGEAINRNIGKYIIPYLKQMKEFCPPNFIIGLHVSVVPKILNNAIIYNFEELNDVVTFYLLDTYSLNTCNPKLYNGVTPITKSNPGENYLYGLEEVVSNLKKTKISFKKLVFRIPVGPRNSTDGSNPPQKMVCKGNFDNSSMCVQTSRNYYDKGEYFHDIQAGIQVSGLDFDDYGNTCQCRSAFNGLYNIYAGYTNSTVIPCKKFDVQSTVYRIK
ncbi:Uncharacterized protein FWK35_00031215, partial [Aphis craccivora]